MVSNVPEQELVRLIAPTMRNAGLGIHIDLFGDLTYGDLAVCKLCLAPPEKAGFKYCYKCSQEGPKPHPKTFFLTYSGLTPQSLADMVQYKAGTGQGNHAKVRLRALTYLGLMKHFLCMSECLGGIDAISYVPSGKSPTSHIPDLIPTNDLKKVTLEYAPPYREDRATSFELSKFRVAKGDVAGRNILLIEDSWYSGYNARSAAHALSHAGAHQVGLLVLARRLDGKYGRQQELISVLDKTLPYNPNFCPVSFTSHD